MRTREDIIAFVRKSFAGVDRAGGLSLREADVLQRQGTTAEREKARILDDDLEWQDVAFDDLKRFPALPGLDPVGFRYYLAAYMLWILKEYEQIDRDILVLVLAALVRPDQARPIPSEQFSALNQRQAESVALFLEFLMEQHPDETVWSVAQEALESYWQNFFYRQ